MWRWVEKMWRAVILLPHQTTPGLTYITQSTLQSPVGFRRKRVWEGGGGRNGCYDFPTVCHQNWTVYVINAFFAASDVAICTAEKRLQLLI